VGQCVLLGRRRSGRGADQFLGLDPAEYMKKPRLMNLKGTFGK